MKRTLIIDKTDIVVKNYRFCFTLVETINFQKPFLGYLQNISFFPEHMKIICIMPIFSGMF